MTKKEIIEKHWVKPSELYNVKAWQEAIEKMMDDWVIQLILASKKEYKAVDIPNGIENFIDKDTQ